MAMACCCFLVAEAVVVGVGPDNEGSFGSGTVGVGELAGKREVRKSTALGVVRDSALVGLELGGGVVR